MCTQNPTDQTQPAKADTMPWVHEDLTTEADVEKYFPEAVRYAGTHAGFNKFLQKTKWDTYDPFSKDTGGAAWRLENNGSRRVKIYSKSAGPYSPARAFTRDALTWFGNGMIQMSLPYHSGSHDAHEYMVPNGDDENHRIGVVIQFWVSHNVKECVRFDLGCFRPVRKWKQGGFWKTLLVQMRSELIENINSMIETSIQKAQEEITELKKKHDNEIADKYTKIKDLTDQVASLSTQNKKLKGKNKRLHDILDDTKEQLDDTKEQLDDTKQQLDDTKEQLDDTKQQLDRIEARLKDANARLEDEQQNCKELGNKVNQEALRKSKQIVFLLERKQQVLQNKLTKLEKDLKDKDEFISRQSRTLRKYDIPASQLEP